MRCGEGKLFEINFFIFSMRIVLLQKIFRNHFKGSSDTVCKQTTKHSRGAVFERENNSDAV
jgi:hypothetical protein